MQPQLIALPQLILVGFGFFGDPFADSNAWSGENEIGRLWSRFMKYRYHKTMPPIIDKDVGYELHIEHDETHQTGHYEIFVGVQVADLTGVSHDLLAKILPAGEYAVFTLHGEQIISDWSQMIYHDWLPDSGYQQAYPYMFERYDARFKGLDKVEESEIEIYIPVRKIGK